MVWDRLATAATGRRCWLVALVPLLIAIALLALSGVNDAATRSPVALPGDSESARVAALLSEFADGDQASALLVATRKDGLPLSPDDLAALAQACDRMAQLPQVLTGPPAPMLVSADGHAALAPVVLSAQLSGFELTDTVKALRAAARDGLPGRLATHITGGPAFGADIADAFTGANVTLLVVTALVVALLLIVTYRSPVLWLAPLIVIAFADRVATVVGADVARVAGVTFDGSTSGITSVLVFGAGTNYALLLISRYREELRAEPEHRIALRSAVTAAGPAILASNATVVLALLTLILAATPSTRSLGLCAGCGLVVAAVFVLLVLPPLLAWCGRKVFWPFIPRTGSGSIDTTGPWHRVADAVCRRPAVVCIAALAVLAVSAAGLAGTGIGLSQTEQFRLRADSVSGFEALAQHFPGGAAGPTVVVGPTGSAPAIGQSIAAVPGVVAAVPAGQSATGLTKWSVVLDAAPATDQAFTIVAALRDSTGALVGGADAQALDVRDGAVRDRRVLIPLILLVVLAVLFVLLRAAVAPPVLVAATVLSALAALGLGSWVSLHAFGFPALDNGTPLLAFLFLVALGVDYTIFLVTRAREETPAHGTRAGMVRAVSATGGVITSAGVVLAAVFCVLGVLPLIVLTQLGIIVGLGILLDTFVVRTLVIPALFALIGDRVWWPSIPR
ncbi:MMPL family transporter [[Mycobacterium] zoologicum]|uniref:MMPL family transporter n=1 Tax=[Mycobacterium] zoologicum TaxID=2872311 RepID=UPI001CDB1BD5|nr:MMPL family transporter [Mycolicibacter sp. MYC101]MEB3063183.1 MMPL family transporter [Mycolicibacter sp. MYC101]